MNDEHLASLLAPRRADVEAEWSPARSAEVLDRILGTPTATPRLAPRVRVPLRRHKVLLPVGAAIAAAAAVVAGVLVPTGTPGAADNASAAPLRHLAAVASTGAGGPELAADQYQYVRYSVVQPAPRGGTRRSEEWQNAAGQTWLAARAGACPTHLVTPAWRPGDDYTSMPLTVLRSQLPATPNALVEYFAAHPQGENHGTANIFESAVTLLMRPGSLVPARMRAALFTVLSRLDGVTVHTSRLDSAGRPAVTVTRQQFTYFFDPSTSEFLEFRQAPAAGQPSSKTLYESLDIVAQVRRCH